MKINTSTITWLIGGFIWCIFMGVTAISIGFGAEFPPLNLVAKPFVCPSGEMIYHESVSNPLPGTTYTQIGWYCVDKRSEQTTELGIFPIALSAGTVYGLLLFVAILIVWYFNQRRDPSKETAESKKRRGAWIQAIIVILVIGCVTLLNLMPLFRSLGVTLAPTPVPNATATMLALTYETLTSGKPHDFSSTDKPLANWNDIPIMPQAIAGQLVNKGMYVFKVPVDTGTIETFYTDTLKSLGWNLDDTRWLGMKFTKDKNILLVTLAPANDMESWIVSLVLVQ